MKKILFQKSPSDGAVQRDLNWKDKNNQNFRYILFEHTKHSFDKECCKCKECCQCKECCSMWFLLEDVKSAVEVRIVIDRHTYISHAEWYILSCRPRLPYVIVRKRLFKCPYSQTSHGTKFGEQDQQVVLNTWLITLSLVKCFQRYCCTWSPMSRDDQSCKGNWVKTFCRCCKWGATKISSIILYLLAIRMHVTWLLQVGPSKKDLIVNVAVTPHHILNFCEWSGISWNVREFSMI